MVQVVVVQNDSCEKFSYPSYAKNRWLVYAVLSLVVIAPMPLYGYMFFNKDFDGKTILIFLVLGVFLAAVYRNLNQKYKHLYRDICVCDEGLVVYYGENSVKVGFDEIVDAKEFGRGSKYNINSAGDEGLLIMTHDGREVVIFSSISNYEKLKRLIEDCIVKD